MVREIFVFGSNLKGIHGAGAALTARQKYGAELGVGVGATGYAYAIPTKITPTREKRQLPLERIKEYVDQFLVYARNRDENTYLVARIGCGLAGYTDEEIGPMFASAPSHVRLPIEWEKYRKEGRVKTRVINIKDAPKGWEEDEQYVYIGRAGNGLDGYFGNPHVLNKECDHCAVYSGVGPLYRHTREDAIADFEKYFNERLGEDRAFLEAIKGLRGKTLVCFCKPLLCHGDVIAEFVDNPVVPIVTFDPPVAPPEHKIYAGIGSRETPGTILDLMASLGGLLAENGWYCRSGNATGADQAFARGVNQVDPTRMVVYLPWPGFERQALVEGNRVIENPSREAIELARREIHWYDRCKQGAQKMFARNMHQVLGSKLNYPARFIVCWTPGGADVGGTAYAIRLARKHGVVVHNMGTAEGLEWVRSILRNTDLVKEVR